MPPCTWMAGVVPCTELGHEHMVQGVVAARIAERSQRMTERLVAARRVYADLLPARTPGHVVANVHCMTGACVTNQPVLPVPTELQIEIARPAETGTLRPLLALMLLEVLRAYFCTSRCNAESGQLSMLHCFQRLGDKAIPVLCRMGSSCCLVHGRPSGT
jgi:hypothetical protein